MDDARNLSGAHGPEDDDGEDLGRLWMAASDMTWEIDGAWNATATYDRLPFIGDELRDIERFVLEMEALVAEDSSVDEDPAADLDVLAAMDENTPPLYMTTRRQTD